MATAATKRATKTAVGPTIRILIVDDEQDLCDYLCLLLSRAGYAPVGLTDPRKTVATLKASAFHLVILDMMMPGLSGTEVLRQIRKIDTDIAIIVSTAYPNVDTAVAALENQVSDYVRKPFEPEAFLATVDKALARKGFTADPEKELHKAIGEAIRRVRQDRDLTLKQLARRADLSVSLISQIERAESSPSISSLYRIAVALGLRISELFGKY